MENAYSTSNCSNKGSISAFILHIPRFRQIFVNIGFFQNNVILFDIGHNVDDLQELRSILKELIEFAGYTCMQFDSAESYLEYFNSPEFVAPIAILSDYDMPGKTGFELIKQVR